MVSDFILIEPESKWQFLAGSLHGDVSMLMSVFKDNPEILSLY